MAKKKYLTIEKTEDIGDLSGRLAEAAAVLEDLREKHGDDAYLSINTNFDSYEIETRLSYTRQETDKERDERLARKREIKMAKKEIKEHKEKQEREMLAKLKEKYEGQ